MKRIIIIIACILVMSSCGKKEEADTGFNNNTTNSVQEVIDQKIEESEKDEQTVISEDVSDLLVGNIEKKEDDKEKSAVDVDLTELSSTMVYSEVFNMVNEPDKYVGKTVRMKGIFGYYTDKEGKNHFGCIVEDATACCAQGIEFVLTDERIYPDEYPELGTEIMVVGNFDYYFDGSFINCVLHDAVFE